MRLAEVITEALNAPGLQALVARRAGVADSTINRLKAAERWSDLGYLADIEGALDLADGTLLRRAGLVADVASTRDALETDPALSADARRMLIAVYDFAAKTKTRTAPTGVRGAVVRMGDEAALPRAASRARTVAGRRAQPTARPKGKKEPRPTGVRENE